jgi:hypothetical protein
MVEPMTTFRDFARKLGCATIAYSSENPAHPIEHLFDGRRDALDQCAS